MPLIPERPSLEPYEDLHQDDVGLAYHRASEFSEHRSNEDFLRIKRFNSTRVGQGPELPRTTYKSYSEHSRILLPKVEGSGSKPLAELLQNRSSIRQFGQHPISLQQLSEFLYHTNGKRLVQPPHVSGPPRRTVPSPGARYSLEVYPIVFNVVGLAPGVYHYNPIDFVLEDLKIQADYQYLASIVQDVSNSKPSVVFIVTSVFRRLVEKYGPRAFRLIYMEAGHLGQNFGLVAEDLDLAGCYFCGGLDKKILRYLDLDPFMEVYLSGYSLGSL